MGNNSASILASLAVIPAIFALSATVADAEAAMDAGNSGLTFIYLASIFPAMHGGRILGAMFFFAMTIAALSSLIAMYELGIRIVCDFNVPRKKASSGVVAACFLFGLPSAFSSSFLDNQDFVWGVGLLISGLFCALAMLKYGVERARAEIINHPWSNLSIGRWWSACIRLFPLLFVCVFGWWIWQSVGLSEGEWWSPFKKESPGTMIFQWGIVIILAFLLIRIIAGKTIQGHDITQFDDEEEAA
jgi:NSS family neurotransmitter:Na+ symporter